MARGQATTKVTTNREEIRRWVESKGGWPARVKGTERGNDPGLLRIDFPGFGGIEALAKMSWDDWFKWFDKKRLALVHQPSTRFSKLIARDTATAKAGIRATPRRATGAKRATAARGAAKRATTKRATTKRTTTAKRTTAKLSRVGKKPAAVGTTRRGATAGRASAKRATTRATTSKRTGAKRTKRGAAKRSTAKRASR
ncbi:MAG: hypothetical protein KF795_09635 [Labilithrix sp.]|nr:hypothetical protein [Labilithrix sp.]